MKKNLKHLPPQKHEEIKNLVRLIRQVPVVEMIILFGSYARGNWVDDVYTEGHITYEYISDYDILIVVKDEVTVQKTELWDRLRQQVGDAGSIRPSITLIVHDLKDINKLISNGQYFFTDIIKEGILLYDSDKLKLAKARKLSLKERKKFATEDLKSWFKEAKGFFKQFYSAFKRRDYKIAAFELHQTAERFYQTVLLVCTHYKPKIHDLHSLGKQVAREDPSFKKIFPQKTEEERRRFKLLREAYTKARYDTTYRITRADLEYLSTRVQRLQRLTKKVCDEKIKNFG